MQCTFRVIRFTIPPTIITKPWKKWYEMFAWRSSSLLIAHCIIVYFKSHSKLKRTSDSMINVRRCWWSFQTDWANAKRTQKCTAKRDSGYLTLNQIPGTVSSSIPWNNLQNSKRNVQCSRFEAPISCYIIKFSYFTVIKAHFVLANIKWQRQHVKYD